MDEANKRWYHLLEGEKGDVHGKATTQIPYRSAGQPHSLPLSFMWQPAVGGHADGSQRSCRASTRRNAEFVKK